MGRQLLMPEAQAMEVQIKTDLVDFFKIHRFYFDEVKTPDGRTQPGTWVKICPERTVEEFPGGLRLAAEAGTEIKITHDNGYDFKIESSKPVKIGWGMDGAMFTNIKVEFNISEMHMRVKEGLQGPAAWYFMRKEGWDVK